MITSFVKLAVRAREKRKKEAQEIVREGKSKLAKKRERDRAEHESLSAVIFVAPHHHVVSEEHFHDP